MVKTKLSASRARKSMARRMKEVYQRRWKEGDLDPQVVKMVSYNKAVTMGINSSETGTSNPCQSNGMESFDLDLDSEQERDECDSDNSSEDTSMETDNETYYETEFEKKETESKPISGRRIINISYFINQLKSISHKGFGCSFWDVSLISEKLQGLESIFTFKCDVCGMLETVRSDDTCKGNSSGTNISAVLGAMAVGIGYTQLSELFAAVDVPGMSNKTYNNCSSILTASIDTECQQQFKQAGEEERRIATKNGALTKDNMPIISVIVDGAWSKRSYRTNYNASSGVACIIGAQTKKILFLGVKNKYCFVCARSNPEEQTEHVCFKNWGGNSTAMEAAIIADGFRKSIAMHGLIYGKVIGDGDSSVYRKLIEVSPYGPTFIIEKVECRNHLLRNYINRLADLSKATNFPVAQRKSVTSSDTLRRFRTSVTKALEFRKKQNLSTAEKIVLLRKDIANGPNHIFGEHSQCDDYFCKKRDVKENNMVSDFKLSGVYESVMTINKRLYDNVSSLLHDTDTNAAETFNSVVAKFIGGKRINFSLKGIYDTRCKAAGISYNTNGNFLSSMHEHLFGNSHQAYHLKKFGDAKMRAGQSNSTRRVRKQKHYATTDEHYGPDAVHTRILDMQITEYNEKAKAFVGELNNIDKNRLCEETMLQGHCEIWKVERKKRLTASNFGKICKLRKTTSTAKTVESLLYSNFKGTPATEFGLGHENAAIQLFEREYGKKVKGSGLVVDKDYPFLACSPDGLVEENAIVEIKSSYKSEYASPLDAFRDGTIKYCMERDGKWSLKKTHNHYYQVQGLLHITNRESCYFITYTKGGIFVEQIRRDDTFWTYKMANKLSEFFFNSLLPELVDPRRCRDEDIREIYMS